MLRLSLHRHPKMWGRWQTQIFRRGLGGPRYRLLMSIDLMAAVVIVEHGCPTYVGYAQMPEHNGLLQSPYHGQDWRPVTEQVARLAMWLETDVRLATRCVERESIGDSIVSKYRVKEQAHG